LATRLDLKNSEVELHQQHRFTEGHRKMPVTSFCHKGYAVTVTIELDDDGSWRSTAIAAGDKAGIIRLPWENTRHEKKLKKTCRNTLSGG
jgi:hypothetical protein